VTYFGFGSGGMASAEREPTTRVWEWSPSVVQRQSAWSWDQGSEAPTPLLKLKHLTFGRRTEAANLPTKIRKRRQPRIFALSRHWSNLFFCIGKHMFDQWIWIAYIDCKGVRVNCRVHARCFMILKDSASIR